MQNELVIFVYGTLTDGMVHFDKLKPYITTSEPATAQGFVYRTPVGFPAFMTRNLQGAQDGAKTVGGLLLRLNAPDLLFRLLDEFYGYSPLAPDKSLHWKEKITVQKISGEVEVATVYVMNPSKLPKGSQYIEDGDWRKSLQNNPPLSQELTEKQANYIRRLSSSTGREIVPIDLALYRELLKLDLIVDKGRRLALTKLGKEVARYL